MVKVMAKDAQISASEVLGKTQAFVVAHENCPEQMVEAHRGEWSLVLWCRWCSCLETYRFGIRHPLEDVTLPIDEAEANINRAMRDERKKYDNRRA